MKEKCQMKVIIIEVPIPGGERTDVRAIQLTGDAPKIIATDWYSSGYTASRTNQNEVVSDVVDRVLKKYPKACILMEKMNKQL